MTAAPPAVRGTTFVPSVRECQHRLDRLRDTAQIVADLDRFNAEMWGGHSGCGELNAASQRLRELHQLCLHMAANMSGGLGVPPTPPSTRPSKRAAGTDVAAANAPMTRYWQRTPDPAAPLAMPTYNAVQAAKVLDVSLSYFYRMCSDGKVPLPACGAGRGTKVAWAAPAIDELAMLRRAAPSTFALRKAGSRTARGRQAKALALAQAAGANS